MNILIRDGHVITMQGVAPKAQADLAISNGRIIATGDIPRDFSPNKVIDAAGCWVLPGLIDLNARLGEPGGEHANLLETELMAAGAGGITSVVCPPDTTPVLDEPGLVEMLKFRAQKRHAARVFPLGALTRGLKGEALTAMVELSDAGCVGFGQADIPVINTQTLQRAMEYAATHDYSVWLRPQDAWLGKGIAASGACATRLGLSGIPVIAETIALQTIFDLMRITGAKVHLQRLSSQLGVKLLQSAKREGLPVTADVSINSLFWVDNDIGFFDSRMRLSPPLRANADRDALRQALIDGVIDAIVSDHTPVSEDGKSLPFAHAQVGATGLELLLHLVLRLAQEMQLDVTQALQYVTTKPAGVLQKNTIGHLSLQGQADVVVFDPSTAWRVTAEQLVSQGKQTPFFGQHMHGKVKATVVNGHLAYESHF